MIFRFSVFFKHDLFRKPVSTFRDHAIGARTIASSRQKSPGAPVECQPKIFAFAYLPFAHLPRGFAAVAFSISPRNVSRGECCAAKVP
jgi:hypothetical protein